MRNTFILLLTIMTNSIFGQDSLAMKKMESLNKMVGIWEGSGWYMDESRRRLDFTQREEISSELGGTAILIKGQGFAEKRKVHDALGIVKYDKVADQYSMYSLLADGKSTQASMELLDNGDIVWGFKVPGGTIQYVIQINEGMTWSEKGSFSPDGENWYPFIAFELTKK